MTNINKAHLKTEGSLDYKECKICYYTYNMFNQSDVFNVNVNLWVHYTQNDYTKSLAIDKSFKEEKMAIKYGIEQGKKYINDAYEKGDISSIKPDPTIKDKTNKK